MSIEATDYPAVRRVMGDDRLRLDDDAIEEFIERTFPDSAPEDVENFMRTIQQFGRAAAPLAQRALPGVAQGAMTGAALGPWGALAGGIAGGVGALAGGGGRRAAPRRAPSPAAPAPAIAPQPAVASQPVLAPQPAVAPEPGVPAYSLGAAPAGAPAAAAIAQLLTLLSRPETMQALLAMLMPASGRPTVPVGQQQVAPAAFANAIAELASIAATDESVIAESASSNLYDSVGQPRGDLANPAERAAILMADLAAAPVEDVDDIEDVDGEAGDESWEVADAWEEDESTWDDAIDSYERVANGDGY